jgi:hypothetical protein
MKTHHYEAFSSVIDTLEGRFIDTNTFIEKKEKKQSF